MDAASGSAQAILSNQFDALRKMIRGNLKLEDGIEQDMIDWIEPSIKSTFDTVFTLHLLDENYRPGPRTLDYVRRCYVEKTSEFGASPRKLHRQSLLNVFSAIGIWRIAAGLKPNENLTHQRATDIFDHPSGKDYIPAIRDRIVNRYLGPILDRQDGFIILDLHLAQRALGQLCADDKQLLSAYKDSVLKYLADCFFTEGNHPSYSLTPLGSNKEPYVCLTACYAAYRISISGFDMEELHRHLSECVGFVWSCFDKEEGAFGTRPNAIPNVVHSHFGHSLVAGVEGAVGLEGTPPYPHYEDRLNDYVSRTRGTGGYGFMKDYLPCAFPTRAAVHQRTRLADGNGRFKKKERNELCERLTLLMLPDGSFPGIYPQLPIDTLRKLRAHELSKVTIDVKLETDLSDQAIHYQSKLKQELAQDPETRGLYVAIANFSVFDKDGSEYALGSRVVKWKKANASKAVLIVKAGEDIPTVESPSGSGEFA